jgi:hypothetical protein
MYLCDNMYLHALLIQYGDAKTALYAPLYPRAGATAPSQAKQSRRALVYTAWASCIHSLGSASSPASASLPSSADWQAWHANVITRSRTTGGVAFLLL